MTAQQLKNSILQMAVQGKLVPQDPNDEPASALLDRIRTEKERLIREKKIKRGNVFSLQAGKNIQASEIAETIFAGAFLCYGGNGIRGYVNRINREGDYPIIGGGYLHW